MSHRPIRLRRNGGRGAADWPLPASGGRMDSPLEADAWTSGAPSLIQSPCCAGAGAAGGLGAGGQCGRNSLARGAAADLAVYGNHAGAHNLRDRPQPCE